MLIPGSTPRDSDFVGLGVAWAFGLNKPSHNSLGNSNVPESLRTMGHNIEFISNIAMHIKCSGDYLAHG